MQDSTPQAVQAAHDLLIWLIPQLDKFPRARRFTLGERLEAGVLTVLELLVEAAYTRNKEVVLQQANLRRVIVRHLYSAAHPLMLPHFYNVAATTLSHGPKSFAARPLHDRQITCRFAASLVMGIAGG